MNGKLSGLRCYESGPIDRAPDIGMGWRQKITPILKERGVIVLDPLNKPFPDARLEDDTEHRKQRAVWKQNGDYGEFALYMKKIRGLDLRMVDISDFLIAYIDMDIFCCGTMEEIFLANRQKKVVVVFCPQGKKNLPDWLFGTLPHELFFTTMEEVISYLDDVDQGRDIRTFGRWLFPCFEG